MAAREPSTPGPRVGAGATKSPRPPRQGARRLRAVVLFVAGVLVFTDYFPVAITAFVTVIAMLLAIGVLERRLRAVAWAAIVAVSAFVGDVLWQLGWEPFDRSTDYESIPQTPFVLIALPVPMALVAVGVAAGALYHRLRSRAPADEH